jgi:hypothetical protein
MTNIHKIAGYIFRYNCLYCYFFYFNFYKKNFFENFLLK